MKRVLLTVLILCIVLLAACGTPTATPTVTVTAPTVTVTSTPPTVTVTPPTVTATPPTVTATPPTVTVTVTPTQTPTPAEKKAQELYDFATEGLNIWESAEILWSDAYKLISGQVTGNSGDMYNYLYQWKEQETQLELLYAPPEALALKNSLLRQLDLLGGYLANAYTALCYKENLLPLSPGQSSSYWYNYYLDKALQSPINDGYSAFSIQNKRDLINLQLQAQRDLQ